MPKVQQETGATELVAIREGGLELAYDTDDVATWRISRRVIDYEDGTRELARCPELHIRFKPGANATWREA